MRDLTKGPPSWRQRLRALTTQLSGRRVLFAAIANDGLFLGSLKGAPANRAFQRLDHWKCWGFRNCNCQCA